MSHACAADRAREVWTPRVPGQRSETAGQFEEDNSRPLQTRSAPRRRIGTSRGLASDLKLPPSSIAPFLAKILRIEVRSAPVQGGGLIAEIVTHIAVVRTASVVLAAASTKARNRCLPAARAWGNFMLLAAFNVVGSGPTTGEVRLMLASSKAR